jgi:uncharacterized membrane protein
LFLRSTIAIGHGGERLKGLPLFSTVLSITVSSALKNTLSTLTCSLGLALSIYLALLKYFALPCVGPGNCHAVIHSSYGSALGVPVGVFGAILWVGAILVDDRVKRAALLVLLSIGAAIFMALQFLVLHGFCLYCTLHALSAWSALALHGGRPVRSAALLGLVLALGGFALTRQHVRSQIEHTVAAPSARTLDPKTIGLPWLGEIAPQSPGLVLSLNCPACLDLLEELSRRSYAETKVGPAVLFKTNDENRALTAVFVAAVLAQGGNPRDSFLAVTSLLLLRKNTALSAPRAAAAELAALFPGALAQQDKATQLLASHASALTAAGLGETTPLLIPSREKPTAFFKAEALFPPAAGSNSASQGR